MKKLFILFLFSIMFLGASSITHADTSPYLTYDFGDGIPEGVTVENEGKIEELEDKTRIFTEESDMFSLNFDVDLPADAIYEVELNGVYGSERVGEGNGTFRYRTEYEGFGNQNPLPWGENLDGFRTVTEDYSDIDWNSFHIDFEGGSNESINEADYLDIEEVKINKIFNIEHDEYLDDFDSGTDYEYTDSLSESEYMTESYLENATVYFWDSEYGMIKAVDSGSPMEGFNYDTSESPYEIEWSDQDGKAYLAHEDSGGLNKGDVAIDGMDSYDQNTLYMVFHDESLNEEDEYDYPLSEYYYYKYVVDTDNMKDSNYDSVQPEVGNTDFMTAERLKYAHIFIDDTQIISGGIPTDNEINDADDVLSAYKNQTYDSDSYPYRGKYSIYEQELDLGNGPQIDIIYDGASSYNIGDLGYYNIDFDDGQSESVVEVYLPHEGSSIPVEDGDGGITDPEESNPDAPEGLQALLSSAGLWNNASIFLIFSLLIIIVNVFLVYKNIRGLSLLIVDLLIYGLFAFMGLLTLVHHMLIVGTIIFGFIFTMKGGISNE